MNGSALFASTVVSSIGLGLFVYGKRQRRPPHLLAGLVLLVFPYFVSSVPLMLGIGGALIGLLYLAKYLGL
jgi:uncharacterized protein (DUF983 family)